MMQEQVSSTRRTGLSLLVLCLIGLVVLLAVRGQEPPSAVPAAAPLTEFSSARAMRHLEAISRKPHPIGSAEHAAVRDYLVSELKAVGLDPQVQRTTVVNTEQVAPFRAATVENVVARLEGGAHRGGAVLLSAHYDSVPTSFGASDDGSAVAALLETARALKAGPPVGNDVIFLLTDGEEAGLLGARAFVGQHPWAGDVAVALNFDARGNGGPVIMFQTSEASGPLVREFARAAPHPVANSLSAEVYKRLPNDTDFTVLTRAGLRGLNFAHIRGITRYHTPLDNIREADERSLAHQGSYALALARHFGDLDLKQAGGDNNVVYFSLPGSILVRYSQTWVLPSVVLFVAACVGLLVYGFRKRELSLPGVALGASAFLLCLLAVPLSAAGLWYLILNASSRGGRGPWGLAYDGGLYLPGLIALGCALGFAIYGLFRPKASLTNLCVGTLCVWVVLAALGSLYLPGASYLLVWPPLFALAGVWLTLVRKTQSRSVRTGLLLSCAVPGIVLLSLTAYQLYMAFGVSPFVLVPVVLLFGLLVPLQDVLTWPSRRIFILSLVVLSVGFVAAARATEGFDAGSPRADNVFYGIDADTGRAFWASTDAQPDEWTAQFLPPDSRPDLLPVYPLNPRQFLNAPAPVAPLAAPGVSVLEDKTDNGVRTLRLRAVSQRGAPVLSVYTDQEALMQEGSINGQAIDFRAAASSSNASGDLWGVHYYAPPAEGVELTLKLRSTRPLRLRVEDRSYGLPDIPGFKYAARPADVIPAPSPYSDATLVGKSFTF